MQRIARHIAAMTLLIGLALPAHAADTNRDVMLTELDLNNINFLDSHILLADSRTTSSSNRVSVPNIPDSAFKEPVFTENRLHMYLGLASLAFGALAGISAPDDYDPDLLNTVHFKAAKLSWQLGAAAIGTGLWSHWDDFHLEDGLLDRDNLHVILGTLGVVGYYIAVKGAVDEYNDLGYPSDDHSTPGILGGAAMFTAIVITW